MNITRALPYFLGTLQSFIGLSAVIGGFGLVADPSGTKSGTPLEWIANTPFSNYFIPGLFLMIVIGAGFLVAAAFAFFHSRYAGTVTVVLGAVLTSFMIVEVSLIGLRNLSQPIFCLLGVVVALSGIHLLKSRQLYKLSGKYAKR